jgi:hypothetical protein
MPSYGFTGGTPMKNKILFFTAVACALSGCTSYKWVATTGIYESPKFNCSMKTPRGWYQLPFQKGILFSRDGVGLENISIESYAWGDTLASKRKSLKKNMLLHELVWEYITSLETYGYISRLQVIANEVVLIDSMTSTRTTFTYINFDGMPKRGIIICTPLARGVIIVEYIAADRLYFARFLQDFEALVPTIAFSPRVRKERIKRLHEIESLSAPLR